MFHQWASAMKLQKRKPPFWCMKAMPCLLYTSKQHKKEKASDIPARRNGSIFGKNPMEIKYAAAFSNLSRKGRHSIYG